MRQHPGTHNQHAFSLVELSIVLVILGLLTGGILAGKSLIRAAELRSVSTEYQRYVAAIYSFSNKYLAIPGDFHDATRFWGRENSNSDCVTNSSATVNSSTGVCDGDGDGTLEDPSAASQAGERFQLWRQLAQAGLIEGTYSGIAGSGSTTDCPLGTNCPKSKMQNGGWWAQTIGNWVGDSNAYGMYYGNLLLFGAAITSYAPLAKVLTPEEAWNIDTKMDDGKPASGKVIARFWNNACAAADDGSSTQDDLVASYRLSDSTTQCALYFRQSF